MNTYRTAFSARCPVNGDTIHYELVIETGGTILAEKIEKVCAKAGGLHEEMADALLEQFGGKQTLTAHHGRVYIKTERQ